MRKLQSFKEKQKPELRIEKKKDLLKLIPYLEKEDNRKFHRHICYDEDDSEQLGNPDEPVD